MLWFVRFLLLGGQAAAMILAILLHAPWTNSLDMKMDLDSLVVCPPPERFCQEVEQVGLFRDTQVPCQARYVAIAVKIAIAVQVLGVVIGGRGIKVLQGVLAAEIMLLVGALLLWSTSGCLSLGSSAGWGLWLTTACAVSSGIALIYTMWKFNQGQQEEMHKPLMSM
jgi:hypothetical protein